MRLLLVVSFWCVPSLMHAAVIINEVAWMGSTASANHEWIELHNTGGSSVDVSDWVLSDGMNLAITLTGTIAPGSYAVLERSSDDSAAGTAFLIYTGALVNTGATLRLTRSDGGVEDQVPGGENWQTLGGDNVTKETAQYTTAGWVTGVATPGAQNSGSVKVPPTPDEPAPDNGGSSGTQNGIKRSNQASETVKLTLPGMTLALAVAGQKVGYVNQAIDFEVTPSGVGKSIAESLIYDWNFGDGTTASGKTVTHAFAYPGKYVVTVYGLYKRQEQVARFEVTVLPVALALTRNTAGEIQISNDSPYEIDISEYQVTGSKTFTFPEYSVLLPNQTITLPVKKTGSGFIVVRDALSQIVTSELSIKPSVPPEVARTTQSLLASPRASESSAPLAIPRKYIQAPATVTSTASPQSEAAVVIADTTKAQSLPSSTLPYIGLIGTILIGLVGTSLRVQRNQNG
jgi:Lamin Tail Domain/PKD domain